jgi:hypothetical protein
MRYFHRTSLPIEEVLQEADKYFGSRLEQVASTSKSRRFAGNVGIVTVTVEAEGGHYTLVTVSTDQPGESEADRLAKRFLTMVHKRSEPAHVVRGGY